jgi:hypothetical protein
MAGQAHLNCCNSLKINKRILQLAGKGDPPSAVRILAGREKLFFTYIHLYLLIFTCTDLYWILLARTILERPGQFRVF